MKIVTFNIRCDYGQDGDNNFCFRKPLILEKLEKEKADNYLLSPALIMISRDYWENTDTQIF